MALELELLDGEGGSRKVPLTASISVGRSPDCELVVDDPQVSWTHCTVWVEKGVAWVRDLGSRNGTFVNGHKLVRASLLSEGDVVTAGSLKLTLRGVSTVPQAPVSLALLDLDTKLKHVLHSDRFVFGTAEGVDLRITSGPDRATLMIQPDGEVWLGVDDVDRPLPVGEAQVLGSLRFQLVEIDPQRRSTVEAQAHRYGYKIWVDLNGATGPVARITDNATGQEHVIDAANRAILIYVLGRRWLQEAKDRKGELHRGWCADDEVIVGVWGRGALADGGGRLKALLHRLRGELRQAGFDPWCLEKRRGHTRLRVAEVVLA